MVRTNSAIISKTSTKPKIYLWIIFCLILIAIILFAIFYPKRQSKGLMQMESLENYEDSLMEKNTKDDYESDKPAMIFFYAPWCGHCKNAKPEFERLIKKVKDKAFMIDCDENKEIAQKYGVEGFPTIRYYPNGLKNGNPREYSGNRTADDMYDFMSS